MNAHVPPDEIATFIPHSIEAEQALLGAVLMNNDALHAVGETVEADHFYEPLHQTLWAMLADRIGVGQKVTPVTLIAKLGADGLVDLAGLTVKEYVARLAIESTTIVNAPDYARTIRDLWARRKAIIFARELQAKAMDSRGADVSALLEEADAELGAIRFGKQVAGVLSLGALAERSLSMTAQAFQNGGAVGFDTGIAAVDEMIGPMMAGDFITILAPSGHGKSALGAQILKRNAEPSLDAHISESPGLMVSMEMDGAQVARRILATQTSISTRAQKAAEINQGQYETLAAAARQLKALPVYIDQSGRQKVSGIIKKLRAMKKAYGIRLAVIDHAKLFKPESTKASKFDTIELAAMELKDAAKELEVTIILLAQVTRESQKRDGWRVKISDLWGGEGIREASDMVLTACIPEVWLRDNEPAKDTRDHEKWRQELLDWAGYAEIAAPKVRDGPAGAPRKIRFDGTKLVFLDR